MRNPNSRAVKLPDLNWPNNLFGHNMETANDNRSTRGVHENLPAEVAGEKPLLPSAVDRGQSSPQAESPA